jgi:hypothetical protein
MDEEHAKGVRPIIGPQGMPLTRDSLPSPETQRWIALRKAEVVAAIQGGLLSLDEACSRYALSREELSTWHLAYSRYGLNGLRAKRVQNYRRAAATITSRG